LPFAVGGLAAGLLAAVVGIAASAQAPKPPLAEPLAQANLALQAGEADKALALLNSLPPSSAGQAEAHNLQCRVRFTLEQWDAAVAECEQAVRLDGQNSDDHLWLGRALGEKAARASFLSAFALAKRVRAEFEESVRLDPRNAEALADLGDFYRQAPAIVGGGIEKAQATAAQLEKVDPARAHELRGHIAEQRKDYAAAEQEFKQAVAAGPHPARQWTTLAGFYSRRKRFDDMDSALHSVIGATAHDKHAAVALYDGAGLLTESNRDPALAANMLEDYLAASAKTEEAPAFVAHIRLARLKDQLGDPAAADRERAAALALAHEYKPARESRPQEARN
jgi:tetratricopeptide (TPR) repeat protein